MSFDTCSLCSASHKARNIGQGEVMDASKQFACASGVPKLDAANAFVLKRMDQVFLA